MLSKFSTAELLLKVVIIIKYILCLSHLSNIQKSVNSNFEYKAWYFYTSFSRGFLKAYLIKLCNFRERYPVAFLIPLKTYERMKFLYNQLCPAVAPWGIVNMMVDVVVKF